MFDPQSNSDQDPHASSLLTEENFVLREIPIQVFTNDMNVARSLMGKNRLYNDDTLSLDESMTVVYRQQSSYLFSEPSGRGPHIDFLLFIVGNIESSVVADRIMRWLESGKVELFSFKRQMISMEDKNEAKRSIEQILEQAH